MRREDSVSEYPDKDPHEEEGPYSQSQDLILAVQFVWVDPEAKSQNIICEQVGCYRERKLRIARGVITRQKSAEYTHEDSGYQAGIIYHRRRLKH